MEDTEEIPAQNKTETLPQSDIEQNQIKIIQWDRTLSTLGFK